MVDHRLVELDLVARPPSSILAITVARPVDSGNLSAAAGGFRVGARGIPMGRGPGGGARRHQSPTYRAAGGDDDLEPKRQPRIPGQGAGSHHRGIVCILLPRLDPDRGWLTGKYQA